MRVTHVIVDVGVVAVLAACSRANRTSAGEYLTPKSARLYDDANIVALAMESDSSEVVLARAVQPKLSSSALKSFAQTLIDDHTHGLAEMKSLAQAQSITPNRPPTDSIPQEAAHLLDRFNAMPPGPAFDTAFVNHEVRDHHIDLGDTQKMAAWARNPALASALKEDLPTLERHLRLAESLGGKP
jgi:putative membrane protein